MLTEADIEHTLTRITYRPGWELLLYRHRVEGLVVRILADVDNAYQPGETTRLDIETYLPPMETVSQLLNWLIWRLGRIEQHEMCEWLRYDNRHIIDPHAQ